MEFDKRKYSAEEVLFASGIKPIKRIGQEIFFRCPHCGNPKGKLKCSVNAEKGLFGCFQCGTGGTLTDLFILSTGYSGDRKTVWKEIGRLLGEQTEPVKEAPFQVKENAAEAKRADARIIDKTYHTLLSMLELNPEHKENLLKRSLSEREIKKGLFASLPKDREGICRKLLAAGCTLEGVPGFFKNRRGEWELSGRPGYLCPSYQMGYIIGLQIRVDKPLNGRKYTWVSSPMKQKGTSSGSPFTYLGDKNARKVLVTEGILKAYVIYILLGKRMAVLGVPGVNTTHQAIQFLKQLRPDTVFEAYDMDKCMEVADENDERKKEMINKAKDKLHKDLNKSRIEVRSIYWDKDHSTGIWKGNYKGLDDFLAWKLRGCS